MAESEKVVFVKPASVGKSEFLTNLKRVEGDLAKATGIPSRMIIESDPAPGSWVEQAARAAQRRER